MAVNKGSIVKVEGKVIGIVDEIKQGLATVVYGGSPYIVGRYEVADCVEMTQGDYDPSKTDKDYR